MNYLKSLDKLKQNKTGVAYLTTPHNDILLAKPIGGQYEIRLFYNGEKWDYMGFAVFLSPEYYKQAKEKLLKPDWWAPNKGMER
jgi:hypothetical protein